MKEIYSTTVTKDAGSRKLYVERKFDAPVDLVWQAWTESSLLDQWWAPRPWKAETGSMDFREGGTWLYSMVGPDGSRSWCRADYTKIEPGQRFVGTDEFCDERGVRDEQMPGMRWDVRFTAEGDATVVRVEISFDSEEDMHKIIEMGFEQGFTAAHGNLDELLAKQKQRA